MILPLILAPIISPLLLRPLSIDEQLLAQTVNNLLDLIHEIIGEIFLPLADMQVLATLLLSLLDLDEPRYLLTRQFIILLVEYLP